LAGAGLPDASETVLDLPLGWFSRRAYRPRALSWRFRDPVLLSFGQPVLLRFRECALAPLGVGANELTRVVTEIT
jgi:hypothetical protein